MGIFIMRRDKGVLRPDLLRKNDFINAKHDQRSTKYQSIHYWIHSRYGLADHCEFCKTTSAKRYQWALRKGFDYERKIINYLQLCDSCHRKYDFTEETNKKMLVTRKKLFASKEGTKLKRKISKGVKKVWDDPEIPISLTIEKGKYNTANLDFVGKIFVEEIKPKKEEIKQKQETAEERKEAGKKVLIDWLNGKNVVLEEISVSPILQERTSIFTDVVHQTLPKALGSTITLKITYK